MKTKISLILSTLLFGSSLLLAQDSERRSLVNDVSLEGVKLMLSPGTSFYGYAGEPSLSLRFRGGALFNDKFGVGGFYEFTVLDVRPAEEPTTRYLDYQAAGAYLEYTFFSDRLFHLSLPLFIGAGEVQLDTDSDFSEDDNFGEENFLVVEPGAIAELRLIPMATIYAGFSYRFTSGFKYRTFDQTDIQGLTGQLGLKFFIGKN
jgi:hypothetical protein